MLLKVACPLKVVGGEYEALLVRDRELYIIVSEIAARSRLPGMKAMRAAESNILHRDKSEASHELTKEKEESESTSFYT